MDNRINEDYSDRSRCDMDIEVTFLHSENDVRLLNLTFPTVQWRVSDLWCERLEILESLDSNIILQEVPEVSDHSSQ
jgi:hypothetical protein